MLDGPGCNQSVQGDHRLLLTIDRLRVRGGSTRLVLARRSPEAAAGNRSVPPRTPEVEARDSPTPWGLASPVTSPVAAVHPGQGHRAQRPAERVDEQRDRSRLCRHGAIEHLDGVAERATRRHGIPQHHHGV